MKTLKKTLSLTLVFALVFSLMSFAFAADTTTTTTNYTDAASITYKEAVDVTSAIGVFQGNDLGAFAPKDNLTREQAAKIITYLTLGKTNADKLAASSDPYTDVAASRWSAGSIAYCKQQGIVAGYGDGKFGPTDTVTAYQFAKMLLVALDYDPAIEGFTGANWAVNVAKDAFKAGLFNGNEKFNGNTAVTREEAALYTCNTLSAKPVTYQNKGTEIISSDGTTIRVGASAAAEGGLTFMGTYYKNLVKTTTSVDGFGRPATKWTYNSLVVGTYAKTAVFTYTADKNSTSGIKAIAADLAGYKHTSAITIKVDGADSTVIATADTTAQMAAKIAAKTGNGTVVQVFVDKDTSEITAVSAITTQIAQVTKVNATAKTATIKTVGTNVSLTADATTNPKAYAALTAIGEKNYVLVSYVGTTIADLAVPTIATGKITAISKDGATVDGLTLGGKSYELSANAQGFAGLGTANINAKADSTLIVDKYGYAIAIKDADAVTNYVVIASTYQNVNGGKIVTMANAIAMDGSAMTMNLGTTGKDTAGNAVAVGSVYSYTSPNTAFALSGADTMLTLAAATTSATTEGTIALTATKGIKASDIRLNSTNASGAHSAVQTAYFGSSVKFIYLKDPTNGVPGHPWTLDTVKTGVQNVTSLPTGSLAIYTGNATNGYAVSAVIIFAENENTTGTSVAYVSAKTGESKVGTYAADVYTLYIDGVKTEGVVSTNTGLEGQFVTYAKDATTGNYTLRAYTSTTNATSVLVSDTLAASDVAANKTAFSTGTLADLNGANANVIDLSGSNITSLSDIKAATGKTFNVALIYNGLTTSDTHKAVSYVFVLTNGYKVDNTANTATIAVASGAKYNVTVDKAAAKDGTTVTIKVFLTDTNSVTTGKDTITLPTLTVTPATTTTLASGAAVIDLTAAVASDTTPVATYTFTMPAADVTVDAVTITHGE